VAETSTPDINEVAAFISSLKTEKSQRKGADTQPAATLSSDTRRSEQLGSEVRGNDRGRDNDRSRDNDRGRGNNRGQQRPNQQPNQQANQQANRQAPQAGNELDSGADSATDASLQGTTVDENGAPISRREKRRLEWIEKRRLWREQKKLERIQRRQSQGDDAEPNEDGDESTQEFDAEAPADTPATAPSERPTSDYRSKGRDDRSREEEVDERRDQRGQGRRANDRDQNRRDGNRDGNRNNRRGNKQEPRHADTQHQDTTDQSEHQAARNQRPSGDSPDGHDSYEAQEPSRTDSSAVQEPRGRGKGRGKKSPPHAARAKQAPEHSDTLDTVAEERYALPPPKRFFVYKDITKKPELSDFVARIAERVEKYMIHDLLVEDGESILVGVSGGVDSVVLLDILHVLSFEHGFSLSVAHVNHGLRGADAKRDEKFVRSLAQKYDVPCHSTQVQVKEFAKKHSLSEEVAARELRYKFFRQTASTIRANSCATAHTADDAAETLLMNLFRGTGLSGLAGIPPRRPLVKKTQLIRPLLQLSKEEIISYAQERELEWFEDETNTLTTYTRNKVRHEVLPRLKEEFNPKIIESLNRTATLLRKADGFIESFIDSTYHSVVNEKEDSCVIDIHKLEALHEFLQSEIIERCISTLTFGRTVSFASMDRILSLLNKEVGARETIVNNLIALRNRGEIVLMYEQHLQEVFLTIYKLGTYTIGKYTLTLEECHRNDVRIGQDKMVEFFDYDRLPYRLTLRTWHAGDILHAIGLHGHVKISDLLTNEKVDAGERASKLVLATSTDIIWACGLRMSEDFKITNETRRIVRATFSDKG
jgi:tRNA(Ile)-lysidine synthase